MLSIKMRKVRHSLKPTQSKAVAEVPSAESDHLMVETPPIDDESVDLESSVGRSQPGGASRGPRGSDSDSGDSMFITQKDVPVAERSRRRHRKAPRHPGATSSFASPPRALKHTKRKELAMHLPKYSFFIHEGKFTRTMLSGQQNTKLHNAVMGGFFNSVRDLWEADGRNEDLLSSLPTIDMNGENILPISEEEETSENEDIKVVSNSYFVVSSKKKCTQPWYDPKKRSSWRRPRSNGGPVTSRGGRRGASDDIQTATQSVSGDGDSSLGVETKTQMSNEPVLGKTSKVKKKIIVHEEEKEDEICTDSDATVSDLNPKEYTEKAGVATTEYQADVSQTKEISTSEKGEPRGQNLLPRDTCNDLVCSDGRVKEKKKRGDHESVENGKSQGELVDEDETLILNLPQTIDELERFSQDDGQKEGDVPDSKQRKKKKRRKNRSGAENAGQEVDGVVQSDARVEVDSVVVESCSEKDGGKKKKKKKKRERNEEAEQLRFDEAPECLMDDVEIRKGKKKRSEDGEPGGQNLLPRDTYNDSAGSEGRVKEKRERGDHESVKKGKSQGELVDEDETLNLNLSQTFDELERFSQDDGQKEGDNPDSKQRKKRRKNRSGAENVGQEGDGVVESDARVEGDSVIVESCSEKDGGKKKKKKKKRERNEEAEQLKSDETPEPLMDDVEIRASKKKRRKESNLSSEQAEESRHCLESIESSLSTSDSGNVEGKKNRKTHQSSSNDGEVYTAVNNSDEATSVAENPAVRKKKKKKKKSTCESVDLSHTPEEEESADKTQTAAGPEDQDVQLKTKRKKKKKSQASTLNSCTDPAAQSDDSASARKKKKHPSFLEADAVERAKQSVRGAGDSGSESAEISGSLSERDEVRKKKRKGKLAAVEEEMDVEEPNDLCQRDETVVREKKQKQMTPTESAEYSQTDEDTKVKKKKKKDSVKSALSPKKKGLTMIAEVECVSQFSHTHTIQALNDVSGKKKKKKFTEKVSPEKKSFSSGTQADEPEVGLNVSSPVLKASPSQLETSSSRSVSKKKQKQAIKKKLYNPSEDLFESQCEPAR